MTDERILHTALAVLVGLFFVTAMAGIFSAGNENAQAILQPIAFVEALLLIGVLLGTVIKRIWS